MAKVPDNYWKEDSPARMSDGRIFTDYFPNCSMNLSLQKNLSSWQYKMMLTRNATNIAESIKEMNHQLYGCNNCNDPSIEAQNRFLQNCTNVSCHIKEENPEGVGLR
tara:strand:+ start:96 stop:416 length:321 start_codon:yes stop_codon:yes gene_type:complete